MKRAEHQGRKEDGRTVRMRPRPGQGKASRGHGKRTGAREQSPESPKMPDYRVWHYTFPQAAAGIGLWLALDGMISYLFFRSWYAFLVLMSGAYIYLRRHRKKLIRDRLIFLEAQFLSGMQLVSTALQAGYAMENAFSQALPQLKKIYGDQAMMTVEFARIVSMISLNIPVEKLLMDLGNRSGSEDILSFAETFSTAKRTGGDITAVIRNTVSCIRQKKETRQEIETVLSGKVLEQRIMSLIPLLILGYVNITSPGFLDVMYHNAEGIAIMSACLGVWLAAFLWGRSIVQITV